MLRKDVLFLSALFFLSGTAYSHGSRQPDLTLVGPLCFADGIGRIAIGIADSLKDDLAITWWPTIKKTFVEADLPTRVHSLAYSNDKRPGKVAILTDVVWGPSIDFSNFVPRESVLKIAISMHESTKIPEPWVEILNRSFDVVVVPDNFTVKIYQDCGVKTPIFSLPLITYTAAFSQQDPKKNEWHPFVFGNTSGSWNRKNLPFLMQAFANAFGDCPDVRLVIHSRGGTEWQEVHAMKKKLGQKNITYIIHGQSWKNYIATMAGFDCYVSFSKGEGYSFAPREALSLGIPVIISDNTAHGTLCATNFVKSVPSTLQEPAYFEFFGTELGHFFSTRLEDATQALLDVYHNYRTYLLKAHDGRTWIQQFQPNQLKRKYLNLVKPNTIILGEKNEITDEYFMTNSIHLYEKYKCLHH